MAKLRSPRNQIITVRPKELPEYGQLVSIMQNETASIITDYIRQYIGVISDKPEPGSGIFLNWDRVLKTQTYQELAWYDLYQEVERDPHVSAIMQSAKLNVAGAPWDVVAHLEAGEKKPTLRNQAIADFAKHALGNTGYFPQHLYNLMDALGKGFAVSEVLWKITDEGVMIANILNRPQRRFQFDAVTRTLRLRNIANPYFGDMLPEKKFIVHRNSSMWENPFGDAVDQSLYWMWLFKKTVLKFWMQQLQVAASSIPIVKHPASANKELKAEALSIAEMIRNGAYGRIPDNFEIIWAEAQKGASNAESYNNFVRMCNDEMSKAVNGQTLTTEASSGTGTGTRALGQVHEMTQTARDVYRSHALESTLNSTLIKWLVDFNFSGVEGYPQFRFDSEDPTDLAKEATIVKTLSDSGFKFDTQELSEKFNYTLTEKAPPPQLVPFAGQPKPDVEQTDEEEMKATTLVEMMEALQGTLDKEKRQAKEYAEQEASKQEAEREQVKKEFALLKDKLHEVENRHITIHVPTPIVNVAAPKPIEFRMKEPNIVVNVPEQKPPIVNVMVEESDKEILMERDGQGWLSKIIAKRSPKR